MFMCIRAFSVELHDKEKKKKGRYCTNECMRVESMKEKVVVVDETVEAGENVIQPQGMLKKNIQPSSRDGMQKEKKNCSFHVNNLDTPSDGDAAF